MRDATWTLKIRGGALLSLTMDNLVVQMAQEFTRISKFAWTNPTALKNVQALNLFSLCFQKDKSSDNDTIGLSYIIYIISFPVALPKIKIDVTFVTWWMGHTF